MLLTIYYIATTWLQSNRIRKFTTLLSSKLAESTTVVFYKVPPEVNEVTATLATSELCSNKSFARIADFIWLSNDQRGCSILPMQQVHLGPWISFPEIPTLIPFDCSCLEPELQLDKEQSVFVLLEAGTFPDRENEQDQIMIEEYGIPIAWKIDSNLAIIIESDILHLTNLLIATFMRNRFSINDRLPLIRIESVAFDGEPQPISLLKNHLRKNIISRSSCLLNAEDWRNHLDGLKGLSILANQAIEFEYNKNRTEGKTGIVKPDLIPSKNVDDPDFQKSSEIVVTPKKLSPVKFEPKDIHIVQASNSALVEMIENAPPKAVSSLCLENKVKVQEDIVRLSVQAKQETNQPLLNQSKVIHGSQSTENASKSIQSEGDIVTGKVKITNEPDPVAKGSIGSESKRPILVRSKNSLMACKPPNVLVYSDSTTTRENMIETLKDVLALDAYTIYPLSDQQVQQKVWIENTSLLVICGSVNPIVGAVLLDYFLKGGKLLSVCSDILRIVLPTYRTAEIREHEMVQFSYSKWKNVKMMHHIFCYQPSPVKKHFSHDGEESMPAPASKKPALVCPRSAEVKDLQGAMHSLDVKVLGTEETWNTPSILLASNSKNGGKAVFSQVHLEANPNQLDSETKSSHSVDHGNKIRLEIFADLLKIYLDICVQSSIGSRLKNLYKPAYFLGKHESKFELLEKLKSKMDVENKVKCNKLQLKFCGKADNPPQATETLLPILIHSCPEDFSTVEYFDNLRSKAVGRLVIYTPVVSSSMHAISDLTLMHGIAVIPRRQTNAVGRNGNQWLSPEGCAMFSLQLHINLNSNLGRRIPLLQQLIAVAIVHSILSIEDYKNLDIGLKWPNDIYANRTTKIGGLIVNSLINSDEAVCNVGAAINLNNSSPTVCINDLIRDYNRIHNKNLPLMGFEKFFANSFNEIERILEKVQTGESDHLYDLYYKYWLHSQQVVTILDKSGREKQSKIIGIDDFGYLQVQTSDGKTESVHPDGNSFDMLRGLILPK